MKPWAREQIERGLATRATIDDAIERTRDVGKVQRTAHGEFKSRCNDCGEELVGETAATRHMKQTGHHRYEVPL